MPEEHHEECCLSVDSDLEDVLDFDSDESSRAGTGGRLFICITSGFCLLSFFLFCEDGHLVLDVIFDEAVNVIGTFLIPDGAFR